MKRLLTLAIHNDSLYFAKHSIIDYSLFVIVNHAKKTIRLGIIDYIQQYSVEKMIESFVKSSFSNEEPTIISPELYKQRFRTSMDKYFIAMIPDEPTDVQRLLDSQFGAGQIKWFTKEVEKCDEM